MGKSRDRCIEDFEAALKMLPEISDSRLNQAYVIETLAGLGNAWIYKDQNEIYRHRLKEALANEKARRKAELAGEPSPQPEALTPSPSPKTGRGGQEAGETPAAQDDGDDIDLAQTLLGLQQRIEELETRNRELEAARETYPAVPEVDPRGVLEKRLPGLQRQIETLNDQIQDLECQREEVWGQIKSIEGCLEIL